MTDTGFRLGSPCRVVDARAEAQLCLNRDCVLPYLQPNFVREGDEAGALLEVHVRLFLGMGHVQRYLKRGGCAMADISVRCKQKGSEAKLCYRI